MDGTEAGRGEEILNGGWLYDFYETKDGGHISFGGLEPQFFTAFCETIGRPDLVTAAAASQDCGRFKEEVRLIIKTRTRDEWTAIFSRVDACVEPVLGLGEALTDPHIQARGLVVEVEAPGCRKVKQIGHPIRYSATPPEYRSAGVCAGAHTREIMGELGYTESEIDEFEKTGLFS